MAMSSPWDSSGGGGRGAYAAVAQTDDAHVELTTHGKELSSRTSSQGACDDVDGQGLAGEAPTRAELATLPRVADALPWGAFLVAVVELCERFAYYGLSGPFQNYMANEHRDANGLPGAIGLGQAGATALGNLFQFWCYLTPIGGAVVADQFLGKYATIKYFSVVYMAGIVILFVTSLPVCIENGVAFPGLVAAMIVIGVGTGGIKSNVSPMIAEQVRTTKPFVRVSSSGEKVIVDPEVTVQRIYMVFYLCINVGSISAILTTTLELHVGFWSAYLLPLVMFCVGFCVLVSGRKRYVIRPPQGGVIGNCFRALWIAARNGFDLDKARPSLQHRARKNTAITWTDGFVDELRTALVACKAFLFFPVYWLCFSQMLNNFISQAGQMNLHGLPNDILPNIDPITIILLIPLLDRLIYPFLRTRLHLCLAPTQRITGGFVAASLAMAYAAALQSRIYASPPSTIHVAWQAPAYALVGLSEALASVAGLELAYTLAPASTKSLVMALFLLTSAAGSALGALLAPWATDPHLVSMYAALAALALAAAALFRWTFGRAHHEDRDHQDDDEAVELMPRRGEEEPPG